MVRFSVFSPFWWTSVFTVWNTPPLTSSSQSRRGLLRLRYCDLVSTNRLHRLFTSSTAHRERSGRHIERSPSIFKINICIITRYRFKMGLYFATEKVERCVDSSFGGWRRTFEIERLSGMVGHHKGWPTTKSTAEVKVILDCFYIRP